MKPYRRGTRPNVVLSRVARSSVEALESRTLLSVGSIAGNVFTDTNLSYSRNPGEPGIAGVRVYIDANNNGRLDAGEKSTLSSATGNYNFAGLAPGSYVLREITPSGFRPTSPWQGLWRVNVASGQNVTGVDFGNTHTAVVSGSVFRDTNGNGVQNPGEPGLAGWRVYVDANNNGRFDAGEVNTVTNATGGYSFTLNPGTYRIREVVNSGYTQTSPAGGSWVIALANGQILTGKSFGNRPGTVVPPPPPPPTTGGFIVTSTRVTNPANSAQDIVTFYAKNPGTGALAGTREILGEDATLSSAGGLVIRTFDSEGSGRADDADFAGEHVTATASYIGLSKTMFLVSTSPDSNNVYHDLQTVRQFEVVGLLLGGVLANSGAGARIAVAVVPHGSAVNISGFLGAEAGSQLRFSASA